MTRFIFFLAALRGPRTFTRLALFYVVGMLVLFYCVIGGLPKVPHTPAHPMANPPGMIPEQKPLPSGLAEEMRKRLANRQFGPHQRPPSE